MPHPARRTCCLAAAALAFGAIYPGAFAQGVEPPMHRMVIQMSDSDPQKWNLALNNAHNALDELGPNALQLEIVAYGPGIGMLKADSPVAQRVADALGHNVRIVACENTMWAQKLTKPDMLPGIGYVSSGVVELVLRQQSGWAYIRP